MTLEAFRQEFQATGDVPGDAVRFLQAHGAAFTAQHVAQVAAKA